MPASARICLVTDRRRLARRQARPLTGATSLLLEQVEAAAAAGVSMAIVRERDLAARELVALARDLAAAVRATDMQVVVNDRLDVAIAAGLPGVHLRESSFTAASARQVASAGFLVGRSVHSVDAAARAGPVDYLVAGTLFPTTSKAVTTELLGVAGLSGIVAAAAAPVLAIGGITTAEHVRAALAAGAAGVAVVGALQPFASRSDFAEAVQNCVRALQSGFDLPQELP